MSYCVNCGVELADSEKKCPLCGVRVVNPAQVAAKPVIHPYPEEMDTPINHLDRRYVAAFVALVLLIPALICLLCDLFPDGAVSWSIYVLGAEAVVYAVILFPLVLKKANTLICLGLDMLVVMAFVWMIAFVNGQSWFWPLACPLIAACFVLLMALVALIDRYPHMGLLAKVSCCLIASALYVALVEVLLYLYLALPVFAGWSTYAFVPLIVLAVAGFLLNRNRAFKEQIKRRFFI